MLVQFSRRFMSKHSLIKMEVPADIGKVAATPKAFYE